MKFKTKGPVEGFFFDREVVHFFKYSTKLARYDH
jgi:hypothetical protein